MKRAIVGLLVLIAGLLSQSASGAAITLDFPSASSTVVSSSGDLGGAYGYFWSVLSGDSIEETFVGTGLASVNGLDLSLTVTENVLNSGAYVNWDVLVNGSLVGQWTWAESDGTGPVNLSYVFGSIAGGSTYTIRMAVTNEVASGAGSIAIGYPGSATLRDDAGQVPEPATFLLAGLGLMGFLGVKRCCSFLGERLHE